MAPPSSGTSSSSLLAATLVLDLADIMQLVRACAPRRFSPSEASSHISADIQTRVSRRGASRASECSRTSSSLTHSIPLTVALILLEASGASLWDCLFVGERGAARRPGPPSPRKQGFPTITQLHNSLEFRYSLMLLGVHSKRECAVKRVRFWPESGSLSLDCRPPPSTCAHEDHFKAHPLSAAEHQP